MVFEIMDDEKVDGYILSYQFDWFQDILTNMHETQFNDQFRMTKTTFNTVSNTLFVYTTTIPRQQFNEDLLIVLGHISHHDTLRHMREFFQIPHVIIFKRIAAMADYIFYIPPKFINLASE